MDRSLTFIGHRGSPLRAQALLLRSLTRRAVSLPAVLAIIGVASRAVRLAGVERRNVVRLPESVLAYRDHAEMVDIHASPVLAGVVNDATLGDGAEGMEVRYPVRSTILSTQVEHAVAITIRGAGPDKAVTFGHRLGSETLEFIGGECHASL